ncbi:MAG: DUF1906 domain-containing protein [Coriobacteriia bacterium]|nr:DUF1906 domain-containing protein [Coriobacteriia bacterium]
MKRIILALALVAALTGCAPKAAPVAPVVHPQAVTTATVLYGATNGLATGHWLTQAWSGGKVPANTNLYQLNSFGTNIAAAQRRYPGKPIVLDHTSPVDPLWLHSHGYGIIRYIATSPWKCMTFTELRGYVKAGVPVGVVYESTAARALSGRSAGVSDAKTAQAWLAQAGYPKGFCWVAVDTDTSAASVRPYFEGWDSVIGAARIGVYGGARVTGLTAGKAPHGFDVNVVLRQPWYPLNGAQPAPKPSPAPIVVRPANYHTRAVMRHTAGLYADAHLTHRIGWARSGGVVSVLNVNSVRTVAHVAWGGHDGFIRYNAMRWLP